MIGASATMLRPSFMLRFAPPAPEVEEAAAMPDPPEDEEVIVTLADIVAALPPAAAAFLGADTNTTNSPLA